MRLSEQVFHKTLVNDNNRSIDTSGKVNKLSNKPFDSEAEATDLTLGKLL